jgi:hypothetical protein
LADLTRRLKDFHTAAVTPIGIGCLIGDDCHVGIVSGAMFGGSPCL